MNTHARAPLTVDSTRDALEFIARVAAAAAIALPLLGVAERWTGMRLGGYPSSWLLTVDLPMLAAAGFPTAVILLGYTLPFTISALRT